MSVLILTRFWNICVKLALYGLLVTCVLKRSVTPTLTFTAQVDESVLHICIETQQVIDYMFCTCCVCTSSDSRIFFKSVVMPTLTYTSQVDKSVTCLF